ncbi:MAG TPA: S8 family serine peptidase, partial [Thermoanaerobaculia bacterium]
MAAKKKARSRKPLYLERWLVEQLMFGTGKARRFTQDSPVLPDVWLEFATDPAKKDVQMTALIDEANGHPPLKLLLTPYRDTPAGEVRKKVMERVRKERQDDVSKEYHANPLPPRVVYNQSTVMATLYFEDVVRAILPLTDWWQKLTRGFKVSLLREHIKLVAESLEDPEHAPPLPSGKRLPPDVLWMIRIIGALALVHRGEPLPPNFKDPKKGVVKVDVKDWTRIVEAVADLIEGIDSPDEADVCIHAIALNRVTSSALFESRNAVKADAATSLFHVSCKDIRWVVIDSGIDATHPAFRVPRKDEKTKRPAGPFDQYDSRVRETYDFTQLEMLLDPDSTELTDYLKKGRTKKQIEQIEADIRKMNDWLAAGRSIDWSVVAPLLEIRHDASYNVPTDDHGTHVAGIIGGNYIQDEKGDELEEKLVGICPDIQLIDLRILDAGRVGDEFTVMAALQFIRWLNATNDFMAVHGVNMSLSIPHDVANYACGRTPVCEEAERVVSSGVVVVVAAGNQGYRKYALAEGGSSDAYNTISITDPGNADAVITVGATHRVRPHTYGVSYFSSRGPTGDGRSKPDLVAPGEKITSPLPGSLSGVKDGTSMAAPHVSGAAAMLMARHNELVGRPQRIKEILCRTATD